MLVTNIASVNNLVSIKTLNDMFQLAVPPADWPGHKTLSLTVTPFTKSCRKENRNLRFLIFQHKDQIADVTSYQSDWWLDWSTLISGVALRQVVNASEGSCSVMVGSTAHCQALNPWTKPLAATRPHLQSWSQPRGRSPVFPQWQVWLAEPEHEPSSVAFHNSHIRVLCILVIHNLFSFWQNTN